jgi:hypothetical protein
MADEQVVTAEAEQAERTSRWEDYIDVFVSPAELYRRRAQDRVGPPLVTLLLLGVFFYFVMLPANRIIMQASIVANPEAAQALERMGTLLQILGSIFVPVTYLFVIASAAAVLLIVGRVLEIPTEFSRTMLVATYAAFTYLLAQVAGGVAVLLHGDTALDLIRHVSFGPLRFVGHPEMNPVISAVLRRFELFTLWQTVLWGVGLAVIYRVSRIQAAATAGITWLLLALPAIVMAAIGFGQPPGGG